MKANRLFLRNFLPLLLPIVVPLFLLGVFSFVITDRYISASVSSDNLNTLEQITDRVDMMLMDMDIISMNFMENPSTINLLRTMLSKTSFSLDEIRALNMIMASLNPISDSKPYINSVYIYYHNPLGRFLSSSYGIILLENFYDRDWYNRLSILKEEMHSEVRTVYRNPFEIKGKKLITIYKSIPMASGAIVFNIDYDYVYDLFISSAKQRGQRILVFNEDKQAIVDYDSSGRYAELSRDSLLQGTRENFHRKGNIIFEINSNFFGWEYYSIVPKDTLLQLPNLIRSTAIILIVISFLFASGIAFWVTRKNYQGIQDISTILESADRGSTVQEVPKGTRDEYATIIRDILKIFIEQKYLKVQLDERRYHQRSLELMALQSQINPHFLFNTLNAIYWEVMRISGGEFINETSGPYSPACSSTGSGKVNQASAMIEQLSDILEYSLSDPGKTVTLEDEIRYAKSYIAIQQFRYKDKFEVVWEYENDVPKLYTMKLLLQPLIENAIYHGAKEKKGSCEINIILHRENDELHLEVSDDGVGITAEKLEQIRKDLAAVSEHEYDTAEHIGLYNTYKRLLLFYGERCTLSINGAPNKGVSIKIMIPILKKDTYSENI